MAQNYFDIHAHVNDVRFDDDREDVLARMRERCVFAIDVGTDNKTSQGVVVLAENSKDRIWATIGIHPNDDRKELFNKELFTKLAKSSRVVAVGECGLDYSRLADVSNIEAEKNRQKELFEQQIDFAIEHNLPLMIHCRDSDKALVDAHRDVIDLLHLKKNESGDRLRGDIHFFAQTIDIAREYFALGFTISFTGVLTFTHEYDEVVRLAPLDKIMAETDCPYVAPTPYRGKRNEPVYVEEVYKKIAELRGEDFETVRAAIVQNVFRTFNISLN